jgi:uncharacterized SAM-binding protein YcdF (DUF218 family)
MRSGIIKIGVVLVIVLLAVGSCRKAGSWLVKADYPGHADVMVMLMGSISDRVLQTADLYTAGVAAKVLIVESERGAYKALEERGVQIISNTTQACTALIALGIPADSIVILPGDAASTRMEAEILRDYLRTQTGIDTLLLVTSAEHTRRAFKIFNAAFTPMEESPVLYCSPNSYTKFHADKWWRSKDDIEEVLKEYLKLVNFVFFERRELRKAGVEKREFVKKKETPRQERLEPKT